VKTFFGNFTPVIGSSMKSSTQSLDFPLTVINGIIGREREKKKTYTQQLKQSLSDYAQED
jgi:hypothetical protein